MTREPSELVGLEDNAVFAIRRTLRQTGHAVELWHASRVDEALDVLFAARAGAGAYHAKPASAQELTSMLKLILDYWLTTSEATS